MMMPSGAVTCHVVRFAGNAVLLGLVAVVGVGATAAKVLTSTAFTAGVRVAAVLLCVVPPLMIVRRTWLSSSVVVGNPGDSSLYASAMVGARLQ